MSKRRTNAREEVAAKQNEEVAAVEIVDRRPLVGLERAKSAAEERANELRSLEDQIHKNALTIIDDSMYWTHVSPHQEKPPQAWVDELGEAGARRRLITARMNHLSSREAPVGIKTAGLVAMGITRARSTERQAPRSLNISLVQMSAPLPEFPELEIGDEKR